MKTQCPKCDARYDVPETPATILSCSGGACDGFWCFSGDTLISMFDGSKKKIKEVETGDKVLSWDFKDNKTIIGISIIPGSPVRGYSIRTDGTDTN